MPENTYGEQRNFTLEDHYEQLKEIDQIVVNTMELLDESLVNHIEAIPESADEKTRNNALLSLMVNVDQVKKTVSKLLDDQLKKLHAQIQQHVMQWMAQSGIDSVKAKGKTIYQMEEWVGYAKKGNEEGMFAALRDAGLDDVVKTKTSVHFRTMQSLIKEHVDEDTGEVVWPTAALDEAIETTKRVSVRVRGS